VVIITSRKIPVLWYYLKIMERSQQPGPSGDPMLDHIYQLIVTMGGQARPEHYEYMGRQLAGLDDSGLGSDPATNAVRDVLSDVIHRNAEAMASSDDSERAEATRFFGALADVAQRQRSDTPQPEKTSQEIFMGQSVSGQEVRICCIEVLDRTDSPIAETTRQQYGIPPGAVPQERNTQERPQVFKPEEQDVAAMVLNIYIGIAEEVTKTGKFITPAMLLGDERQRRQIEDIALADDRFATGTPEQRRAIVKSVFDKLPGLLHQAFKGQQAKINEMRRETRDL
jgi:hypothetical protein